ncbi:hypothetical protein ACWEO4_40760 [Streptomyces sp. NPDC004393]|uniref:hypothetical protein n=1 Tax=Streptomyces sp. NPDC004533 TaxID=3154278 RepID=UPI0033BBB0C1
MTTPEPLASAHEMHGYLIGQLNLAVRRPGMHGGEPALQMLMDHLLFLEFGPPSVLIGGTNSFCGKTLAYVSEKEDDPIVSFHLWNGSTSGSWPPDHQEPLLLAVRYGDGPFRQRFTLTPEGERRLSSVTPSAR